MQDPTTKLVPFGACDHTPQLGWWTTKDTQRDGGGQRSEGRPAVSAWNWLRGRWR